MPNLNNDFRRSDSIEDRLEIARIQRQSRIVEDAGLFHFLTREGITVGPFSTQFDAELGASLLISRLAQLDPELDSRSEILRFIRESPYLVQATSRAPGTQVPGEESAGPLKTKVTTLILERLTSLFLPGGIRAS